MENSFANHVLEWKEMNKQGQFVETRHFYFEKLFQEEIDQVRPKDKMAEKARRRTFFAVRLYA